MCSAVEYKRKAKPKDICDFIKKNGPSKRVEIIRYITKGIVKQKIDSMSETTVNTWIKDLRKDGKIRHRADKYYIPKIKKTENQKKISKIKEPSENQDNTSQEKKELQVMPSFSQTVEREAKLAQVMQDTTFLLDSAIFLLEMIHPRDTYKSIISEAKYKCKIHTAAIKKIINAKFTHLIEPRENEYQKSINEILESHTKNRTNKELMTFDNISNFRDVFSDMILKIRYNCERNCKHFVQRSTYYEDATYSSSKLVAISLNEICRDDYDLIVEGYEYDENLGMFKIDVSELKMISPHEIKQVYCNGRHCIFDFEREDIIPYPDHTILFYPDGEVSDISTHVVSVMLHCAEFSFVVKGKQKTFFTFLDHIKDDVAQMDLVYPQYESNTIMLTPQMGDKIKDTIESLYGKKFVCSYCSKEHPCQRWLGYPHSNGVPDKDGKKYWMMIKCWNRNSYVSLDKILDHIVES